MRATRTVLIACGIAATLLSAPSASADPVNARDALVGTGDCGPDGTFNFTVNSGNAHATAWDPAFATRSDGAAAIFHPLSVDLVFTSPFGSDTEVAAKPGAPGPVSCSITGSPVGFPEATLTGTVTGTLTWLG
jgi:hypothetical protein